MKLITNFNANYAQPGAWLGLKSNPTHEVEIREDFAGTFQSPQWGIRKYYRSEGLWYKRMTCGSLVPVKKESLVQEMESLIKSQI